MPKKPDYEAVSLDLTKPQLRKLHKGQCCQLKPAQMSGGSITLMLSRGKVRKLHTAHKKQKGHRLKMSQEEIEKSGDGFKDVMKAVGRKIKKGIKSAGPEIRKGLTTAIKVGLPALAVAVGQPELAVPAKIVADTFAKKAVDALGDKVGFGSGGKKKLKDDYSQFQSKEHPSFTPALPLPDFSKPNPRMMKGGMVVKTGAKTSVSYGGRLHPAMRPALAHHDFSRPNTSGGSFLPAGMGFKPAGY